MRDNKGQDFCRRSSSSSHVDITKPQHQPSYVQKKSSACMAHKIYWQLFVGGKYVGFYFPDSRKIKIYRSFWTVFLPYVDRPFFMLNPLSLSLSHA